MRWIALAVVLAIGILSAPLVGEAQSPAKVPRIGILFTSNPALAAQFFEAFKQGLREHGYVEGQSVIVERRYAEARAERLSDLAAELVRLKVDVIVAPTDLAIRAAKDATSVIPIVMTASGDPAGAGFVASLARPGGNITGLSTMAPELTGKRVELLREIVPSLSRLAFLWHPEAAGATLEHKEIETAAQRFKLHVQSVEVRRTEDIDDALAALTRERPNALVLAQLNPVLFATRSQVTGYAAQRRLPTMCPFREFVDTGGLIAYGPNIADLYRRAATYVDKILKGVKPADLPVEQPTKFELVINLKTAKALGLTIPQSLLQRADQVIDQ